jgi:hypothetical protein
LLDDLKAAIVLPANNGPDRSEVYTPSFFKRWLPAFSVAVWLIACVVILAVQSTVLNTLRNENESLRAAALDSAQAKDLTPENQALLTAGDQLTMLRAEKDEAQRLRAEILQLNEQLKELNNLQAENQRLLAGLQARAASGRPPRDFFDKAQRIKCVNNLKQVALAARIWANKHNDTLPPDLDGVREGLPSPEMLFCPDSDGAVQYEIVSPGISEEDPSIVFARCPIHFHVALVDGSVQQIGNRKLVVRPDGKTVIGN